VSRAALIKPRVERAVTAMLLGAHWDSALAVWALAALELCVQDEDINDCAESLNILFKAV
jgi:hypothetical protein